MLTSKKKWMWDSTIRVHPKVFRSHTKVHCREGFVFLIKLIILLYLASAFLVAFCVFF